MEKELQERIDKTVKSFQLKHFETMKTIYQRDGSLRPQLSMLYYKKSTEKFHIHEEKLNPFLLNSPIGKDSLSQLMRTTVENFQLDTDKVLCCVCFSSEGWARVGIDIDADELKNNYDKVVESLPKKEVINCIFENGKTTYTSIAETIRVHNEKIVKFVNEHAQEETKVLTGRFANLFNKK